MGNFNQAINQLSKAKELLESITQITEKALDSAKSDCISKVLLLDVFCNWSEDWISELNKDKWWKYYENLSINKDTIKDTINVAKVHVEKLDKLYKEKKILDDAKKQIKRLTAYTESVFDGLSALNTANSNIEWLDKDNNLLHGSIEKLQAGEPVTLDISLKNKEGYAYTEYDYKDNLMLVITSESGDIIAKKALSTLYNFSSTDNSQYTATHYLEKAGQFTLSVTLQGQDIDSLSDPRSISINVDAAEDINVHKTVLTVKSEEGNGRITFEFTPKDRFNNTMTDKVFTDPIYLVRSRKGGTTYEHVHSYDIQASVPSNKAFRKANKSISFNHQENDPGIWRYMLAFDLKDIDESSDIAPVDESLDLTETSSIDLTADVTHAVEIDLSHLPEQNQSGMYNPKRIKYVRANPQHQYNQYLYQRQIKTQKEKDTT